MERKPIDPDEVRYTETGSSGGVRKPVDFGKTSAFTGEDERFAYKRAQSRLWEMCGARWWARNEADWHRPLPAQVRRWERSVSERSDHGLQSALESDVSAAKASDVVMGEAVMDESRPDESFKHGATSPFRTSREPPPKFSWTHVWGMMRWGPKAGAWGKGVEGLKERDGGKR
ncbi:hypothetical protein KC352_g24414 [Hortaea werneckii]|nr:hypothetical protein KC352_g24414 [Hortaea werneckii]